MADLLEAGVAEAPEEIEPYLRILLYIADSSITYRTRYLTALRTDLVLDLLLVDESNPRSIAFQLASLLGHLDKLPEHDHTACESEKALVAKAIHSVRVAPHGRTGAPRQVRPHGGAERATAATERRHVRPIGRAGLALPESGRLLALRIVPVSTA